MSRALAALALALLACPALAQPEKPPAEPPNPTVREVKEALATDSPFWTKAHPPLAWGSKAFPAYHAILADPKADKLEVARVFLALGLLDDKEERSEFREDVFRRLTDDDRQARLFAILLLGKIGSERDTPPVVALLYDEESDVGYAAATVLARIGGRRDLVAFDLWLRAAETRKVGPMLLRDVRNQRDALAKRLGADVKKLEVAPPPQPVQR